MTYAIPLLLLASIGFHIAVFRLSPRLGLIKPNYRKTPIMASYGIAAFAHIAAIAVSLGLLDLATWPQILTYLAVMTPMWILGTLDDLFGTREVGGFRGHFKKLLLERQLTTGAAKAIGGGMVGLAAGWVISGGEPVKWVLAAALIPLSANILNLFDLRPGRAVAVLFCGLGVTCITVGGRACAPWLVGCIAAVALAFGILDSKGRAMMGDSGSNTLGSAMGLTIVLSAGVVFQAAAIAVMIAVHLYSEKHSVSALIERNPVLRSIDRRLGVR